MNFHAMNKRFGKIEKKQNDLERKMDEIREEVRKWQKRS